MSRNYSCDSHNKLKRKYSEESNTSNVNKNESHSRHKVDKEILYKMYDLLSLCRASRYKKHRRKYSGSNISESPSSSTVFQNQTKNKHLDEPNISQNIKNKVIETLMAYTLAYGVRKGLLERNGYTFKLKTAIISSSDETTDEDDDNHTPKHKLSHEEQMREFAKSMPSPNSALHKPRMHNRAGSEKSRDSYSTYIPNLNCGDFVKSPRPFQRTKNTSTTTQDLTVNEIDMSYLINCSLPSRKRKFRSRKKSTRRVQSRPKYQRNKSRSWSEKTKYPMKKQQSTNTRVKKKRFESRSTSPIKRKIISRSTSPFRLNDEEMSNPSYSSFEPPKVPDKPDFNNFSTNKSVTKNEKREVNYQTNNINKDTDNGESTSKEQDDVTPNLSKTALDIMVESKAKLEQKKSKNIVENRLKSISKTILPLKSCLKTKRLSKKSNRRKSSKYRYN